MKKIYLTILAVFTACLLVNAQQDTITGFNFADTTDTEFNADFGLPQNLTYDIRAEDTAGNTRTLSYTNGATDYAATATEWDAGANVKYWSIKFKADGFSNMKVYSKQRGGGANPGPKYWKLQCQKSGQPWEDIAGDTVVVGNDWTTGVVNGRSLPSTMDFPGTTSLYIRWIMVSDESVSGSAVLSTGISKIDDIIVTGDNSVGVSTVIYENKLSVYPNPVSDMLWFESEDDMSRIEMYDMMGNRIINQQIRTSQTGIDVSSVPAGLYFVRVTYTNSGETAGRKIIVQ